MSHDDHPGWRVRELFVALVVVLLSFMGGCRDNMGDEYVEPHDAAAQLVVHADGGTVDIFLDGERMGRISWTQAYGVSAGQHVFRAEDVPLLAMSTQSEEYTFVIASGQTIHLAVVIWYEREEDSEFVRHGIRISEIQR